VERLGFEDEDGAMPRAGCRERGGMLLPAEREEDLFGGFERVIGIIIY